MRIQTDGDFEYREDSIERAVDVFDANKTKSLLMAAEHAHQDRRAKRRALNYAAQHMAGEHVQELAELLSTAYMSLEYETEVAVSIE